MSEKLTPLEWQSVDYVVRCVDNKADLSEHQFKLVMRALEDRNRPIMREVIDKLQSRVEALQTGPGCRWSHDKDAATIAGLQEQIDKLGADIETKARIIDSYAQTNQEKTIANLQDEVKNLQVSLAEVTDRRDRQMRSIEADAETIRNLQAEVEKLAAENLELNERKRLDGIQRETDQAYIAKLQNFRSQLNVGAAALTKEVERQREVIQQLETATMRLEAQRDEARQSIAGAKATLEYITKGPWRTVDEYVLSLESCLKAAKEDRKATEQRWFEVSKERDAAVQSNADLRVGLSERLATIQELNSQIKRLQGIIQGAERHGAPLEVELKQLQATLTREREKNVRTLNALQSERDLLRSNVDEWRKEAMLSDDAHEQWRRKAEHLAADHARLLAEKAHADSRVDELAKELFALQPGPCPGEDMRDHVAAQAKRCPHVWAQGADEIYRCERCSSVLNINTSQVFTQEELLRRRKSDPVSDCKADRMPLHRPIVLLGKLVPGGAPDRGIVECRGCNCLLLESRETCKRCEDDIPF